MRENTVGERKPAPEIRNLLFLESASGVGVGSVEYSAPEWHYACQCIKVHQVSSISGSMSVSGGAVKTYGMIIDYVSTKVYIFFQERFDRSSSLTSSRLLYHLVIT